MDCIQLWFWVERIDVAGSAFHGEKDACLGLWRVVRRLWGELIFGVKQRCQSNRAEGAGCAEKEIAAVGIVHRLVPVKELVGV